MSMESLYRDHLRHLDRIYGDALAAAAGHGLRAEGVLLHSGTAGTYHADDAEIPFRTVPHFAHWVPLPGPDHLLLVRPGQRPRLFRTVPPDYWYEAPEPLPPHCEGAFDLVEVPSRGEAARAAGDPRGLVYLGDSPAFASRLGIPPDLQEPELLLAPLDWARASKTPYEVACLRASADVAARGHRAAREAFRQGASERQAHAAYLEATGLTEHQLPYGNIVALDEKAAILHYQNKRDVAPGRLLLIDAGGTRFGYATDVTRTYLAPAEDDGPLAPLLNGMDRLERSLVAMVEPGKPYPEIHETAHRLLGALLAEVGISRLSAEETFDRGVTRAFLPHGVGHHLGLQVHDVGGHQKEPSGGLLPPPETYPFLRNTRVLEAGHVVTIEPGVYFIPMLLTPLRESDSSSGLDWDLIEELTPYGGIRIEDDILVTPTGHEDLTRPLIPGHRD